MLIFLITIKIFDDIITFVKVIKLKLKDINYYSAEDGWHFFTLGIL